MNMRLLISSLLKQSWSILIAFSTKIEEIPEILQLLVNFLKEEPIENFTTSTFQGLEVPLTLNPDAEAHFKDRTKEFPFIYTGGGKGDWFNFIYATGQVLTNIAMVLESFIIKKHGPELETHLESFYHIWGGIQKMNAQGLVDKHKNRSAGDVKRLLISKLEASIGIFKKDVLPFLQG